MAKNRRSNTDHRERTLNKNKGKGCNGREKKLNRSAGAVSIALAALLVLTPFRALAAGSTAQSPLPELGDLPFLPAQNEESFSAEETADASADTSAEAAEQPAEVTEEPAEMTEQAAEAGQTEKPEQTAETEKPEQKESVSVHLAGEPGDPVPGKVMDADTASLLKQVSEGLVTLDESGQPVPGSAEKWKVSEDGLRWEFTLRDDLRWADGEEMDASDFEALFRKIADPTSEALYGSDLTGNIAGYEDVLKGDNEALAVSTKGDDKLIVELSEPDPDFARKCASWALLPIREQVREDDDEHVTADWEKITGNGPYMIASTDPGQEYVLQKNPYYHGSTDAEKTESKQNTENTENPEDLQNASAGTSAQEPFEEVRWKTSGDINEEYSDFLNGEIEAVAEIPEGETPEYQERVVSDTLGILFNCRSEALEDPLVRSAMAAAIDRDFISSEILGDNYVPADVSSMTAFSTAAPAEEEEPKTGDMEGAQKLLRKAGREDGKDIPTLTCIADENGGAQVVAEYLASVWRNLGIDVKVETADAEDLAEEKSAGTFDIICGSLFLASDVPDAELASYVSENDKNVTGFASGDYDELMEQAAQETSLKEYEESRRDALQVLEEEQPMVPLAERRVSWLRQDAADGIYCDATGCWQVWKTPGTSGGSAVSAQTEKTTGASAGAAEPDQTAGSVTASAQTEPAADNSSTSEQTVAFTVPASASDTLTASGMKAVSLRAVSSGVNTVAASLADTISGGGQADASAVSDTATPLTRLRQSAGYFTRTDQRAWLTGQAWIMDAADPGAEKLVSLPKYSEVHLVGTDTERYARIEQDGRLRYLDASCVTTDPAVIENLRAAEEETVLQKEMLTASIHPAKESELVANAAKMREETEKIREAVARREMLRTQTRNPDWGGAVLSRSNGSVRGPSGKETYYNLNMSGVVSIMRRMGNSDEYWVRDDGCKMLGDYIMCTANLRVHPRGSLVESSLGTCIVCDTGGFASGNSQQLDIAVTW